MALRNTDTQKKKKKKKKFQKKITQQGIVEEDLLWSDALSHV